MKNWRELDQSDNWLWLYGYEINYTDISKEVWSGINCFWLFNSQIHAKNLFRIDLLTFVKLDIVQEPIPVWYCNIKVCPWHSHCPIFRSKTLPATLSVPFSEPTMCKIFRENICSSQLLIHSKATRRSPIHCDSLLVLRRKNSILELPHRDIILTLFGIPLRDFARKQTMEGDLYSNGCDFPLVYCKPDVHCWY